MESQFAIKLKWGGAVTVELCSIQTCGHDSVHATSMLYIMWWPLTSRLAVSATCPQTRLPKLCICKQLQSITSRKTASKNYKPDETHIM